VQDLKVSIAQILDRPGESRDVRVAGRIGEIHTELARLADSPVEGELRLESVVEGVLVTGTLEADTVLTCARCLKEIPAPVEVEVVELFAAPGHLTEEQEVYRITGLEVDLEPMVRDALVLSLPLNPVCENACTGMCAQCGRTLPPSGKCEYCVDEAVDPRWAGLSALKGRLED
jgi:uncharacterized protein